MPNRMSDESTHFFALALNEVSIPNWVHLAVVIDRIFMRPSFRDCLDRPSRDRMLAGTIHA